MPLSPVIVYIRKPSPFLLRTARLIGCDTECIVSGEILHKSQAPIFYPLEYWATDSGDSSVMDLSLKERIAEKISR
jgi:hypothetical protein